MRWTADQTSLGACDKTRVTLAIATCLTPNWCAKPVLGCGRPLTPAGTRPACQVPALSHGLAPQPPRFRYGGWDGQSSVKGRKDCPHATASLATGRAACGTRQWSCTTTILAPLAFGTESLKRGSARSTANWSLRRSRNVAARLLLINGRMVSSFAR